MEESVSNSMFSRESNRLTNLIGSALQIEQERSEEESSVGDALALAFAVHVFARLR